MEIITQIAIVLLILATIISLTFILSELILLTVDWIIEISRRLK